MSDNDIHKTVVDKLDLPRPCADFVLARIENLKVSPGGIILAQATERTMAEVLAVGPTFKRDDFAVGDIVYFDGRGLTSVLAGDGEQLALMRSQNVIAVIGKGHIAKPKSKDKTQNAPSSIVTN